MENRAVGRVHLVGPVHPPGADHPDGRLARGHHAGLHGGGMRAKHGIVINVEGILRVARGMVLGDVEQLEVVMIQLDLGAFHHLEAQAHKAVDHLVEHHGAGVPHARAG